MIESGPTTPWYRQLWPWLIIALLGSAVAASLATVWIAFWAAPERVDGPGKISIPVVWSADTLRLDLGMPPDNRQWPDNLLLTLSDQSDNNRRQFNAVRVDNRHFATQFVPLQAGVYQIKLETDDSSLVLHGHWSYPAPVWKMTIDD